ncbi:hypothetical protein MMC20_004227 [Loxospora ochrophaea]|nr:hypothetical protein [Loxospora ochrophaea]
MAGQEGRGQLGLSRPLSVEQIAKKALNFDYNPLIPLKYWFRTAGTLLKEAEIYDHEGNDQQTYLLLFRHAQLVLGHLSTHPSIRENDNRLALAQAESDVKNSLAKLEVLKPRINKRYERYEQLMKDRDARRAEEATKRPSQLQPGASYSSEIGHRRIPSDPATSASTETLAAGENKELAVKLAHREMKRRAVARKATLQAGIPEEEEQKRRTGGVWGDWEEAFARDDQGIDRDTLSRQMQNVRLQVDSPRTSEPMNGVSKLRSSTQPPSYQYPSIPQKSAYGTLISEPLPRISTQEQPSRLPPKIPNPPIKSDEPAPHNNTAPPIPAKPKSPAPPPAPTRTQSDLQPSTFTFKPSAYLENGSPLRTLFLPPDLRHRFLSLAEPNTRANLETCGILCGTLISNALFISKLVIPDQTSTPDTCETVNENELFEYADGEDLMVLGWIHTHPTQTCFMSSRDLHTHSGYQVMMPESIAIVCAPSKEEWGVFRLTDPPGIKTVLNCTQDGIFHPHAEKNIYTDALRPGHVFEAKGLEFEVVDLRPGRR